MNDQELLLKARELLAVEFEERQRQNRRDWYAKNTERVKEIERRRSANAGDKA